MEKMLLLFILLCSVSLEVRCLQCYVCDNCPKVKEELLQRCGMPTRPGPSTIITTTARPTTTSTTASTTTQTTSTVTTTGSVISILTTTTAKPTTISTTITTELRNTSTTTTEANIIPTITKTKTNTNTSSQKPPITSTTIAAESTTSSIATTTETIISSTTTIGPATMTPERGTVSTTPTTETIITTEINNISISTTSKPSTNFTTTSSEPAINHSETVTEPINYLITTEPKPMTVPTMPFVSVSEPTTFPTTPFISVPKPTILTPIPFISVPKPTTLPTIPIISTLPATTVEPIINLTTESTIHTTAPISVITYAVSANNTKPFEGTNATYNFPERRPRSLDKDCTCKNKKICNCPTSRQRSKRYALSRLALSKEDVKYVCVVDKFQVNETEVVKRGCAIMEENEDTACMHSGFGADCKTCDSDKCNGASITKTSTMFMFIVCVLYFNLM